MITLTDIFAHADIDDVTDEEEGIALVFTFRDDKDSVQILGSDLADCLEQAEPIVKRHRVICDLRREGLTDADIDRLVEADEIAKNNYHAGFIDGASEAAFFMATEALRREDPTFAQPAIAAPMAAPAAAEPITAIANLDAVKDNLVNVSGTEIAITLALLMPARIVID